MCIHISVGYVPRGGIPGLQGVCRYCQVVIPVYTPTSHGWGFPSGSAVKNLHAVQELQKRWVRSLGWEDPLEEDMATHSRILAWRMPWTEEPGGLQSIGSQRIGHDWSNLTSRQPCVRVTAAPVFTNVLIIISILAILVGMQWYCIVILICIFLITSEAEHHFVYYWPFESFLFVKWLFQACCLPHPF